MEAVVIGVVLLIFGVFAFIHIIEIGVRNGINSSIIGKSLEQKEGDKEDQKSLLTLDVDQDK